MRQIEVSTEVFSLIWALRRDGEESEDRILLRVLKSMPSDHAPPEFLKPQPGVVPKESKMNPSPANAYASLNHANWWEVVESALEELGGPSRLAKIYKEVERLCIVSGKRMPQELEATVRGTLEDNSADSDRYKQVRDVFCMPEGKHSGVWGLRRWLRQNKK